VILQIYGISYRSSNRFFNNHPELMDLVGISEIPDIRPLSYRALRMDWHEINAGIIDLIESNGENAAIDSFIVKTCKHTTAQRRGKSGKYKDTESSWGYGTKGFEYGRKTHVAQEIIDSVRGHEYILMDGAYDSSDIYDYITDNTNANPVIDTIRRRGIVPDNLKFNRKQGIIIREMEKARYRLRWEIERTFSILE
jgi:hypothetical protein